MLDGAPVVGQDKADRLLKAITKTASKEAGIAVQTHQIEMPTDDQGQSKGFMFVSLHNPTEAQVFQRALDGYAFDKRHTLSVVPFTEVESYANLDDNYVEPEQEEWAPREHFRAWLADPAGRDQLILYVGDDLRVAWTGKSGVGEVAHQRNVSTSLSASPREKTAVTDSELSGRPRRNGPTCSHSGRRKVPTSRRFICRASRSGAAPRSSASTGSRTPKSN